MLQLIFKVLRQKSCKGTKKNRDLQIILGEIAE